MRKIKFALKHVAVLTLIVSSFIACDKDFATIGSDIVGQNNFDTESFKYDVIAYNRKLNPVQTNGLPSNLLGVYVDPFYGLTTANFVSQVNTSSFSPDFGENVSLDSVVLTVPYYSKATGVNDNGETLYELDSVYGDDPIKLSIFENGYFLRSFNPNSEFDEPQRYFSNATTSSSSTISDSSLEELQLTLEADPDNPDFDSFKPSNKQIILKKDETITRLAPALRVKLDTTYWVEKIIEKEEDAVLSNANNFQNYFRGIYFKTEAINGKGNMTLLNFSSTNANITLYYSKDSSVEAGQRTNGTFVLNFSGNRVNLFSNNFNIPLQDGNTTTGDEKLYIKGGEGSMAVINLFNGDDNGESTEFNNFKNEFVVTNGQGEFVKPKRLVNEANLVFYVDQSQVQEQEPDRVFLYDLKNNIPLIDYYVDITNSITPNDSKSGHLGKLIREGNTQDGQGIKYKIRITEHINNMLLKDSTNVKLGLVVSSNVNVENSVLPYAISTNDDKIARV